MYMYVIEGYMWHLYIFSVQPIFSPNQIEFLFYEDSQYTGVWKYCCVYNILHCLSKNIICA